MEHKHKTIGTQINYKYEVKITINNGYNLFITYAKFTSREDMLVFVEAMREYTKANEFESFNWEEVA